MEYRGTLVLSMLLSLVVARPGSFPNVQTSLPIPPLPVGNAGEALPHEAEARHLAQPNANSRWHHLLLVPESLSLKVGQRARSQGRRLAEAQEAEASGSSVWDLFTRGTNVFFQGPAMANASGSIVDSDEDCAKLCLEGPLCYFWTWCPADVDQEEGCPVADFCNIDNGDSPSSFLPGSCLLSFDPEAGNRFASAYMQGDAVLWEGGFYSPPAVSTSVMFGYEVDGAPPCPNPELMENDDAPESFAPLRRFRPDELSEEEQAAAEELFCGSEEDAGLALFSAVNDSLPSATHALNELVYAYLELQCLDFDAVGAIIGNANEQLPQPRTDQELDAIISYFGTLASAGDEAGLGLCINLFTMVGEDIETAETVAVIHTGEGSLKPASKAKASSAALEESGSSSIWETFTRVPNTFYQGADILDITAADSDAECAELCLENPKCNFWSFCDAYERCEVLNYCDTGWEGSTETHPEGTCILSYDSQYLSGRLAYSYTSGAAVQWSGGRYNGTQSEEPLHSPGYSPSPRPWEYSPSPRPWEYSPSPSPHEYSPSPSPWEYSPSPTPREYSPWPSPKLPPSPSLKPVDCNFDEEDCGDGCVSLDSEDNCGACGKRCDEGMVCSSGECQCSSGLEYCDGSGCINLDEDYQNCGECGQACDGFCSSGRCSCPDGQDDCGDGCVDLDTEENCGSCGNGCGEGMRCSYGECQCGSGLTYCGSSGCVNTDNDAWNCGECGRRCDALCSNGKCSCPRGQKDCGSGCQDLENDEWNCGSCGNRCASGRVCSYGECVCSSGYSSCSDSCVDLQGSKYNCGQCGRDCTQLDCGSLEFTPCTYCSYGTCYA